MPYPGHDARRRLVARVAAGTAIAGAALVAGLAADLALSSGPVSPGLTVGGGGDAVDASGALPPPIVTAPS